MVQQRKHILYKKSKALYISVPQDFKMGLFIRLPVLGIFFALLISSASSHGNYLFEIDLDFDPQMKEEITKAAKAFLKTTEDVTSFDYDRELINARFERAFDLYVHVHPVTYEIYGFRDDNFIGSVNEENFNQDQRKQMADTIYEKIPHRFKAELVYGGEQTEYTGVFKHTWYRYKDGVYISNDHLEVWVNPQTGKVVGWRLSPFMFEKADINVHPAITYEVAQQIAIQNFDAEDIGFQPFLVVEETNPVWITKVKGIYPFFVGIDAMTGRIKYSGGTKAEFPPSYDYGRNMEVKQTELITSIYEG